MKVVVSILSLILFLFSCSDSELASKVDSIETLQSELEKQQTIIDTKLNSDTLNTLLKHLSLISNDLKKHYKGDTIPVELALKIDEYKRIHESLIDVPNITKELHQEIPLSAIRLKHLQYDIENAIGNREKYDDHLDQEEQIVNLIIAQVHYCDSVVQKAQTIRKEHSDVIHHFIEQLKNDTIPQQ